VEVRVTIENILEKIDRALPGAIRDRHEFRGDITAVLDPEKYLDAVKFIYGEGYRLLIDITAVDWSGGQGGRPRFDVVVHVMNVATHERLRLKVPVEEGAGLPSIVGVYKCADWFELEVFDMFGVPFGGRGDMRRLLMWDDFQGHPLRKDFPLSGGDRFCGADTGTSYAGAARSLVVE
jgi:NADH-quinone oxidoreductase subunit C